MIDLEEMQIMLDEITNEFPRELFIKLNGGILLLPEEKRNTKVKGGNLYILGEYYSGGNMGRYIAIYYGSFKRIYGHVSTKFLKRMLTDTLKHEFTHHLESLAGEKDLIIKDEQFIKDYLNRKSLKRGNQE